MNVHEIAVIPGDNVGPEVMREGLKVLRQAEELGCAAFRFTEFPWGAGYYLETGVPMPQDGPETLKGFDAIFFGAHGDPARVPETISSQGLLNKIRKQFDLYVNLRPMRLLPGVVSPIRDKVQMDFIIVRENSEGEYSGIGGRLHAGTPNELALQTTVVTRRASERIIRFAFDLARERGGKKRVTAATKSNALNHTMPLWDEIFAEVSLEYPDVETSKFHVDALAMNLISRPEYFDVIVATNMFGDILSDEAAIITGGLGLAPGANLNPERSHPSIFEPIHGSAPDIAGRGIANPLATIRAGQMMLEWLGEREAALLVGRAVEKTLAEGQVRTGDLGGRSSTSQVGDEVCAWMQKLHTR